MSETLEREGVAAAPVLPTGRPDEDLRLAHAALRDGRFGDIPALCAPHAGAGGGTGHAMLLALAHALAGDVEAAAPLFAEVAASRPHGEHPVDELVRVLREHKRDDVEALPHAEEAVRRRPEDNRALIALASLLCTDFRPAEAEPFIRRALEREPRNAHFLNHLGIALTDQGRFAEAADAFRESASADPGNNASWTNLASTLSIAGEFDEALEFYRRSIMLKPDQPAIRLNHAICLLKAGRMFQGWSEYEFRLKLPGHTTLPYERILPNLAEDTRLDGKTVLVTHEEGLGDTLQFMRYLAPLRDRGAHVIAWVPETLLGLVARIPGIEALAGKGDGLVYTYHCPFLSLPRAFAATSDALPTRPYITADPARLAVMAALLPPDEHLRVGLVWGGDPRRHHRPAHAIDRKRSMNVAALRHLSTLRRVSFVSLQFGPHRDALPEVAPGLPIVDPMDAVRDMDDTAALAAHLDVIVSVDTSMVHLAAGLGRQVILLDRLDNCWRWAHGRDDSPFYPTLRIIRQRRAGDWDGVGLRLAEALRLMADDKARGRTPSVHAAINAITPYPITVPT